MRLLKELCMGALMSVCAFTAEAATFVGDRTDFRDETIYFAMTTRFYDGDPANNTYCWDGKLNVNDPEWRGDFKGLIAKLDYLKSLGFTAVWITPVVENASGLDYHGYHAFDFSKVDPRYESSDCKFQDLIDEAHKRGMKIILDIVLQHNGNFGEANLCPMFVKDYTKNLSNIDASMKLHPNTKLPTNYFSLPAGSQHQARLALMKNTDGKNHDVNNYWHHVGQNWDWDDYSRVWGQIAGDCVDLNTENPYVSNYLVKCYTKFIDMGVDGFRVDTSGHIARLTFNNAFIPQLHEAAEKAKSKRGGTPFFIFGEVCARSQEVIYRGGNYNCSPCFYTWKETKNYNWDYSETSWNGIRVMEGEFGESHPNAKSVLQQAKDYEGHSSSILAKSENHLLKNNTYRTPDHSKHSGLNVIDFPMHWRFTSAVNAFNVRNEDNLYNDATYNVVYVDSHDYGPDGQDRLRFAGGEAAWAENLCLMFTWRGIPCIYYGSEIEFQAGKTIDEGANLALKDGGRAYFGGFIEGSVTPTDFGQYNNAKGNVAATLSHPLARHIRHLNLIRAAVPALRKGQYTTDGCSGNMSFKRRYTDSKVDSYVLVTISGGATFSNIPNGRYVDCVTGDVQNVTNGSLTASCSGKGNMRVYVLDTNLTKAPGKIGEEGKYLYKSSSVNQPQLNYETETRPLDTTTVKESGGGGGGGGIEEPENPVEPFIYEDEYAAFFENSASWGGDIYAWVWNGDTKYAGSTWPGQKCEYLGNKIWKWSYNGVDAIPAGSMIIFSNITSQTQDLSFTNGGYYNAGGLVKTITPNGTNPNPPTPNDDIWTLYYTGSWNPVNCYFWDDKDKKEYLGVWPGTAMTYVGDRWQITFKPATKITSPMVIFNTVIDNNKQQTNDLVAQNGGIYGDNGEFIGVEVSLPAMSTVTQPYTFKVEGGVLTIYGNEYTTAPLYTLDGRVIMLDVRPGINTYNTLPRGFYILSHTKIRL